MSHRNSCLCTTPRACVRARARNQHIAGLLDLKEVKGEGCLLVPHTSVNNTQEPKHKFREAEGFHEHISDAAVDTQHLAAFLYLVLLCCCGARAYRAFLDHPIEHDDSLGLLLPNHEPEVATRVPERTLQTTHMHAEQSDVRRRVKMRLSLTTESMSHNKITVKFPKSEPSLLGGQGGKVKKKKCCHLLWSLKS